MRRARIVEDGAAYYHVISRVVDRRFVFHDDLERERFRKKNQEICTTDLRNGGNLEKLFQWYPARRKKCLAICHAW